VQCSIFFTVSQVETIGENSQFISIATEIISYSGVSLNFNIEQLDIIHRALNLVEDMIGNVNIQLVQLQIISLQTKLTFLETNFEGMQRISNFLLTVIGISNVTNTSTTLTAGIQLILLVNNLTLRLSNLGKYFLCIFITEKKSRPFNYNYRKQTHFL
jgi:hypothetical protein